MNLELHSLFLHAFLSPHVLPKSPVVGDSPFKGELLTESHEALSVSEADVEVAASMLAQQYHPCSFIYCFGVSPVSFLK